MLGHLESTEGESEDEQPKPARTKTTEVVECLMGQVYHDPRLTSERSTTAAILTLAEVSVASLYAKGRELVVKLGRRTDVRVLKVQQ